MANVLTLEEVANYLRVHPSTVYRLLKKRGIPAFKLGSDCISLVYLDAKISANCRGFCEVSQKIANIADCLLEQDEFELKGDFVIGVVNHLDASGQPVATQSCGLAEMEPRSDQTRCDVLRGVDRIVTSTRYGI